jgi:hypothetical protein
MDFPPKLDLGFREHSTAFGARNQGPPVRADLLNGRGLQTEGWGAGIKSAIWAVGSPRDLADQKVRDI